MPPLKIWGVATTRTFRAHWALHELGLDFAVVKEFLGRVKERVLGEKVGTRVRDASGRVHKATPARQQNVPHDQAQVSG